MNADSPQEAVDGVQATQPTTTEVNRWLMECLDVVAATVRSLHAKVSTESGEDALLEAVRVALLRVTRFHQIGFVWFLVLL